MWGRPWWSHAYDFKFPVEGVQVWSRIGELRSHMLPGMAGVGVVLKTLKIQKEHTVTLFTLLPKFWTIFLTFQKIFFFLMSKGNTFRSVNFPFQKLRSWICHLFSKRDSALSSLSILLLLCIHFSFCCDRWSNIVCDRPYHVKYL